MSWLRSSLGHTLWAVVLLGEHRSVQYGYSGNLGSCCFVLCYFRVGTQVEYGGDAKGTQLLLPCSRGLPQTTNSLELHTPCGVIPDNSPLRYIKPDRVTYSLSATGIMPRSRTLKIPSIAT